MKMMIGEFIPRNFGTHMCTHIGSCVFDCKIVCPEILISAKITAHG
jgi:hypothetical protein